MNLIVVLLNCAIVIYRTSHLGNSVRCRHGRYRCARRIEKIPSVTFYKPEGVPSWSMQVVEISYAELEAVRLIDIEGLTQEEASARMGISRRSFWNDLASARKKIAHALVGGHAIQFVGGAPSEHITKNEHNKGGKENAKI
ncbi:MAG: DUF134 domain-containing protein [Euryarchaeota archaeon]|nr:DUF134 domain-containing protein [Euryarchaeota archaeon]